MTTRALYEVTFKIHGDSAAHVKSAVLGLMARRDPDNTEVRVPSIRVKRLRRRAKRPSEAR